MIKYIGKRILQAIPLIIVITILVFSLIQLAPYNAIDAMTTPDMEAETIELIKERYGYDKPAYMQYISWIKGATKGDFGFSLYSHMNIATELKHRIPATMILMLPAYLISYVLALIIGLIAGYNRGKLIDKIIDGISAISIATPGFWVALIMIYFLGYKLDLLPILGMHTIGKEDSIIDFLRHYIMPFSVLVFLNLPSLIRYVRSSAISQLTEDYVTVQRSFGASNKQILFRHISKNVLLPLVTRFGLMLPSLVTGSIIIESVFSWPGAGPYFVKAVSGMDYPVIMTILLLSSLLVVIGSLFADIMYSIIDPRIRI